MYEDTPQELVHDLIAEAIFGSHALGRPVIGTAEVIGSLTKRSILGYHRSMYIPANIVVAAAGNLEHGRLVELVERAVARRGDVPNGTPPESRVKPPKKPANREEN